MSGGRFDYIQYQVSDVAEEVKNLIDNNGAPLDEEEIKEVERWHDPDYIRDHPELLLNTTYPSEVIEEFRKGYEHIKKAAIYIQRIDWLLSGDDGEETFLERIKEDLKTKYEK
jgi:hypothetical protein